MRPSYRWNSFSGVVSSWFFTTANGIQRRCLWQTRSDGANVILRVILKYPTLWTAMSSMLRAHASYILGKPCFLFFALWISQFKHWARHCPRNWVWKVLSKCIGCMLQPEFIYSMASNWDVQAKWMQWTLQRHHDTYEITIPRAGDYACLGIHRSVLFQQLPFCNGMVLWFISKLETLKLIVTTGTRLEDCCKKWEYGHSEQLAIWIWISSIGHLHKRQTTSDWL